MDKYRGNEIILVNNVWVYKDTLQAVSENKDRACGHCGLENTEDGHDGCLEELPGVMNACCGHGNDDEAYVQFTSGTATALYSAAAVCYIGCLKKKGAEPMIKLNVLDDTTMQILGSHDGIAARGTAYKVFVTGSLKRVWQYQLMLLRHPRQVTITSNRKDGTLWNEERLLAEIVRNCEEFESENKEAD